MIDPLQNRHAPTRHEPQRNDPLWAKAQALEAAFLSEMLAYTGVGKTSESFGGGAGEQQFSSFMREEQAKAFVQAGGIGLAQSIFESLKRHEVQS